MRRFWFLVVPFLLACTERCNKDTCSGETGDEPSDSAVRINEIVPNPAGDDAGGEWVELVNLGTEDQDISGFTLHVYRSESSTSDTESLPDGTVLPPGGLLVLGGERVPGRDLLVETSMGSGAGGDGLYLLDGRGRVVDAVVYGDFNEDGVTDETGQPATSLAPMPGDDEALARCAGATDTDRSGDDFLLGTPTPGEPNGICPTYVLADEATLDINEVMVNPEGADEGCEWIEIYNADPVDRSLDGWQISWYKGDYEEPSGQALLPQGLVVPAGGVILLAGASETTCVGGAAAWIDLDLGNGSNGDALDHEGTFEDGVVYGPPNDDGMLDAPGGAVATSLAEKPMEGGALARCPDGFDTDDSATDFVALAPGDETPGALNRDCVRPAAP